MFECKQIPFIPIVGSIYNERWLEHTLDSNLSDDEKENITKFIAIWLRCESEAKINLAQLAGNAGPIRRGGNQGYLPVAYIEKQLGGLISKISTIVKAS